MLREIHWAQQTSLINPLNSASAADAGSRELVSERGHAGTSTKRRKHFQDSIPAELKGLDYNILLHNTAKPHHSQTFSKINIDIVKPSAPQLEASLTRRPKYLRLWHQTRLHIKILVS